MNPYNRVAARAASELLAADVVLSVEASRGGRRAVHSNQAVDITEDDTKQA